MSYYRPVRDDSVFFRLPHDLPIVVSGRPVQDVDLEARVNRALLAEFHSEKSGWKPKPTASEGGWSWSWRGLPHDSLKCEGEVRYLESRLRCAKQLDCKITKQIVVRRRGKLPAC